MAQQCFFTRSWESNENATKSSYTVAMLIAKHCEPFTEVEFIKNWMMKHFILRRSKSLPMYAWLVALLYGELKTFHLILEAKGVEWTWVKSYLTSRALRTKQEEQIYLFLFGPPEMTWKYPGIKSLGWSTCHGWQSVLSTLFCNSQWRRMQSYKTSLYYSPTNSTTSFNSFSSTSKLNTEMLYITMT